jgi:hypothetical protein
MTMATDTNSPVNTAWMWGNSFGGVNGVTIEPLDRCLLWFDDGAGCACDDAAATQSYEQFHERGPVFDSIPADVLAELEQSLAILARE